MSHKFNPVLAAYARERNPGLTVFDTGEMLQPQANGSTGTVDFDNEASETIVTVFAHSSAIDDDTTVIQIDTIGTGRFTIMLNDGTVYSGNPEVDA